MTLEDIYTIPGITMENVSLVLLSVTIEFEAVLKQNGTQFI